MTKRAKDDYCVFETLKRHENYCIRTLEYKRDHPWYLQHYSFDYSIDYKRKDGLDEDVSSIQVRKLKF